MEDMFEGIDGLLVGCAAGGISAATAAARYLPFWAVPAAAVVGGVVGGAAGAWLRMH